MAQRLSRPAASWLRTPALKRSLIASRVPAYYRLLSSKAPPRTVAEFLRADASERLDDAVVHGYVRSVRKLKSDRFLNIGDGSTVKHLQAIVPKAIASE